MVEFDESVLDKCLDGAVIIYGADKNGRFVAEILRALGCRIDGVVDNDTEKYQMQFGNLKVEKPVQEILCKDNTYVIIAVKSILEVEKQLKMFGVHDGNIIDGSRCASGRVPEFYERRNKKKEEDFELSYLLDENLSGHICSISKCILFENVLFLYGWMLPMKDIIRIEVVVDEVVVGYAEKGKERQDVYRYFPFYKERFSGFSFSGVLEEKENCSICLRFFSSEKMVHYLEWFCKKGEFAEEIRSFLQKNDHSRLKYFIHLGLSKEKMEYISRKLYNTLDNKNDKVCLLRSLYVIDAFTKNDMKEYMGLIEQVSNFNEKCWMVEQEIPYMIFLNPSLIVNSVYCWRREKLLELSAVLFLNGRKGQHEKNSVVILLDGLADEKYASSIFELAIADELSFRGYKVQVVVCDAYFDDGLENSTVVFIQRDSLKNKEKHNKMKKAEYGVYYCKAKTYLQKIREAYDVIEEYRPEFIIDISLGGLLVSAGLKRDGYPVIHVPLTGYSSSAVYHKYIAKNKIQCIKENLTYNSICECDIYEAPIKIPYAMKAKKTYHRVDFGIHDSDFVLVTVGNRLKYEMDEEFLHYMKILLQKDLSIKWVVVGTNLGNKLDSFMNDLIKKRQVITWGFEDDLVALYQICDVYVNPNRMGGCGSIEMAMSLKMPIALTAYFGDITPVIKKSNCCSNYEKMCDYIISLKKSSELKAREGKKMYELINRKELEMKHYVNVILEAYRNIVV